MLDSLFVSFGLGLVVGIILALTGAGGGILAVPLLVFGLGLTVSEASPIALLAVALAATLGTGMGLQQRTVRYKAALLIAGIGMLLSPLGMWLAHHTQSRWLSILFSCVLLVVAYRTFRLANDLPTGDLADDKALPCIRNADSGKFVWSAPCARAFAWSGGIAGLLSGLLGVGGGFVIVPALRRYTDLTMQSVVATSLTVIALIAWAGVATSAVAGNVNWMVAIPFSMSALAGMMGGRLIGARLDGPQLQKAFAVVSAVIAIGMFANSVA